MKISVILPAYNEEKRIGESLKKILHFLGGKFEDFEVIVVDDGSIDNTADLAKKYCRQKVRLIQNRINMGKGYSIKKGLVAAKYQFALCSDCDLATPIEELGNFIEVISQGYDIVIGSRNLSKSKIKVGQPLYRKLMGKAYPILTTILGLTNFKDTQCGFKLYRSDIAKKIVKSQTIDRFSFDVEMLLIAKKMSCRIKEIPVEWNNKNGSKVNLIRDPASMLIDLIKIRINEMLGRYNS